MAKSDKANEKTNVMRLLDQAGIAYTPRYYDASLASGTEVAAAQSILLELCSGYLLFAGIFMLNDPTTSPGHWLGRIVYGVLAGALVMLMRHWGRFEEGACFAILLCNALSRALDVTCWKCMDGLARRIRRRTL